MENEVIFLTRNERTLSSFVFYSEILDDLRNFYHSENYNKNNNPPIFSFEECSRISPEVLPLLISLGSYLKKHHNQFIELKLNNNLGKKELDFLRFLEYSGFFNIVGDRKIDVSNKLYFSETPSQIFNFKDELIGGFDTISNSKYPQRLCKFNKSSFSIPSLSSKNFESERSELLTYLRVFITHNVNFFDYNAKFLSKMYIGYKADENEKTDLTDILAELSANSLIYSDEEEVVYIWHSGPKEIILSISDFGKGFYSSLSTKSDSENYNKLELFNHLKDLEGIKVLEKNFKQDLLSIYEALFFSSLKLREGLIDIILIIILEVDGKIRIHNNSTQVIFTSNRNSDFFKELKKIRIEILKKLYINESISNLKLKLIDLFIQNFKITFSQISENINYSPIRFYKTVMPGVHIEVELNKN